jgi:aspartate ammonia-lyase
MAAEAGQLQLNAMEPIIVCNILESIETLTKGMSVLTERCVNGIQANTDHCASLLRNSLVLATALVPVIGYEKASRIAKQSLKTNVPLADIVLEENLLSSAELEALFSVENLVRSTQ